MELEKEALLEIVNGFQFIHAPVLNDRKLPPKHHKLPQFQLFLALFWWNEDVMCLEKIEALQNEIGPETVLCLSSILQLSLTLFLPLPSILSLPLVSF